MDDLATIAAGHEHAAEPAFVWDAERRRILWGNAGAMALFGAESLFDLIEHAFGAGSPEAVASTHAGDNIEATFGLARARIDVSPLSLPHAKDARLVVVREVMPAPADASLARRAALFAYAPAAMVLADLDGAIIEANAASDIVTGNRMAHVADIVGDGQAKQLIATALASGHATASTESDGRVLRASALRIADPIDGGARVLIRLDDVTARRALETLFTTRTAQIETAPPPIVMAMGAAPANEALESALAEAQQKNAAKSEFIATLSHEMRNPLNAIIGFAEIMQRHHFGPLGDRRYEAYAEDIRASADHLLSLVDDLLDLARIESGKLNLKPARVALAPLIEECTRALHPAASAYNVTLSAEVGALPQVMADARSLKQVLINLISNGLKFTGAGGHVRVMAAAKPDGAIVLAIVDSGVGMSAADIARALEPFGQIDGAHQSKRKGTGLGLPIAKSLAEANRLGFEIASEPGKGTVVRLIFPPALIVAGTTNGAVASPPTPSARPAKPPAKPKARITDLP